MSTDELISIKIKQASNQEVFSVSIDKNATISDLKRLVMEKTNITEKSQNLIFKGRILADEKLLCDYSIQEDCMIILVKKLDQENSSQLKAPTNTDGNLTVPGFNMFNQGITPDFNQMMNLLNNPNYMNMINQVISNPDMMSAAMSHPQMQPLINANPHLRSILENPQMLQTMLNPQMLQNAMNMMNQMNSTGQGFPTFPNPNNQSTSTSTNTAPTTNPGYTTQPLQPNLQFPQFNPFLMFNNNLNMNTNTPVLDPKEKYKEQNQKLKEMGFVNEDANIQALIKTNGNVDAAVERLLNMLG